MEWTGLNELREKYLSFFEEKEHLRQASASLVPKDDKSLLLINSGMAPLKNYFLGLETPPSNRMTTCQKCIRTPDIEEVGKTSRHGTYFEMLGNFSFGDYFKEEAILWAWEFLTQRVNIPEDKLYATIYLDDDEAFEIWHNQVGLSEDRIFRLGKEDNFWEIGSGPCGPSSEIFFDRGEKYGCGPDCGIGKCECDRYMELWNLVFTQFNGDGEGNYTPLEHPNIDTGMGLERLATVMQGVNNLFEVDTMTKIMDAISAKAGVTYGDNEETDVSLRVVTDHVRSTVFMVGDGIIPQNEGRGYVLRRLLRRAARHGRLMGIEEPFLYEISKVVIEENQEAYPELAQNADYIQKIILAEEERFSTTLSQGLEVLNTMLDALETREISDGAPVIDGAQAFRLYDTFGFPIDLTREIAEDQGVKVDEEGFKQHMEEQRARARKAHENQSEVGWEADVLAGNDFPDKFVGYERLTTDSKMLAVIAEGELVDQVREGEEAVIVLEETPFYAESGGQIGDTGLLRIGKSIFKVTDTTLSHGHHLHHGVVVSGFVTVGDIAETYVDIDRRRAIMRNHTATHLLQSALKKVLGSHVHQSGSLVESDMLRFDFTHFNAVTPEELQRVEQKVNEYILEAIPVTVEEMTMEDARAKGAIALFGDKYEDIVRVISIPDISTELCGGTHVRNTAEIGLFKITSESSVAAGVRRIEAVVGASVLEYINEKEAIIQTTAKTLRANNPNELVQRSESIMEHIADLQKQIHSLEDMMAKGQTASIDDTIVTVGEVALVTLAMEGPMDPLQKRADQMKVDTPNIVGAFVATNEGKSTLLVFAGKEAVNKGIHAGKLVKEIAALAGGSGGGRPDHAMGGMSQPENIEKALASAEKFVQVQLEAQL